MLIDPSQSVGVRLARAFLMLHAADWTAERCALWKEITGAGEMTYRPLVQMALAMAGEPSLHQSLAGAIVLWYEPGPWTERRQRQWVRLTGTQNATTKALGDLARSVQQADCHADHQQRTPGNSLLRMWHGRRP